MSEFADINFIAVLLGAIFAVGLTLGILLQLLTKLAVSKIVLLAGCTPVIFSILLMAVASTHHGGLGLLDYDIPQTLFELTLFFASSSLGAFIAIHACRVGANLRRGESE